MVLKKTMCPKKTCSHARVPPSGGSGISRFWVVGISAVTDDVLSGPAGAGGILKRIEA